MADFAELKPRDRLEKRAAALKNERSSFDPHWRELAEFVMPRRSRFQITDVNKGDKRHQSIINSEATWALRTATAGMLAGTMSPARPWFKLETPDDALMEYQPVKEWLEAVGRQIHRVFNESNFYTAAPVTLAELIQFATGAMSQVDNFENVARFHAHTVGSYCISLDENGKPATFVREVPMTIEQMVLNFGVDKLSTASKNLYNQGNLYAWVPVTHFVEPNGSYDKHRAGSEFKRWRSSWYEPGNENKDVFLRVKGFDRFPFRVPRWETTDGDVYGTNCPGMIALGDVKQLQVQEKRKAQGIDKMVNPPLQGPAALNNKSVSSLPGGLTTFEAGFEGKQKIESIYDVKLSVSDLANDMNRVEYRIKRNYFVDLFLAISQQEGIQPKNQADILGRQEEKLLQLGPVLVSLHGDFLSPSIDHVFAQLLAANALPPPPREIQGTELRVKYISSLAIAQKAVDTGSIDRLAGYIGALVATGFQDAGDTFDADQSVKEYASLIGAPAKILKSDEDIAKARQARAQQQQQMQAMEMAAGGAGIAKDLAAAKVDGPNALSGMTEAANRMFTRR